MRSQRVLYNTDLKVPNLTLLVPLIRFLPPADAPPRPAGFLPELQRLRLLCAVPGQTGGREYYLFASQNLTGSAQVLRIYWMESYAVSLTVN